MEKSSLAQSVFAQRIGSGFNRVRTTLLNVCGNTYGTYRSFPKNAKITVFAAFFVGFAAQFVYVKFAAKSEAHTAEAALASDTLPIAAQAVEIRDIQDSFSGHAILQPWKEVTLHPDQQVTIREVTVKVGSFVEKGQSLAVVDSEVQKLKTELDQIDLQMRELDYSVTLALAKKDFISKNEQKQKILEHRSQQIRARISAIESSGRMVAPISGVISEVQMKAGDYIDNSSNYFVKIVDPTQLKVSIYLPHTAVRKLAVDSAVQFQRTEVGDDGEDHLVSATGRVAAIAPVVDSKTGSVLVEIVVNQFPKTWRPGLSVEASMALDLSAMALTVPSNAVVYQKGKPYVYRVKSAPAAAKTNASEADAAEVRAPAAAASGPSTPNEVKSSLVAERVPVKLGLRDATHAEIVDGLGDKDMIVVEGQGGLTDGAKVEIVR